MRDVFEVIYRNNAWGQLSGPGSNTKLNQEYFDFVRDFMDDHNIKSVVDLGCGDFRLSRALFLESNDIEYTGIDCVSMIMRLLSKMLRDKTHINFIDLDFFKHREDIASCDLIIIKDVLQHWTNDCIHEFLSYMVSSHKFKYIMIINSCGQKEDGEDIDKNGKTRFLSAKFFPLKKYKAKIVCHYIDKEISII